MPESKQSAAAAADAEGQYIRARFVGQPGQFYGGIPARDITVDEYDQLDAEQRAVVDASPLYKVSESARGTKAEPAEGGAPPALGTYETAGIAPPPGVLPDEVVAESESAERSRSDRGKK